MEPKTSLGDHFYLIAVLTAFLSTLGAYTAVSIVGVDSVALRDVLLSLGGVLGGVAIPTVRKF